MPPRRNLHTPIPNYAELFKKRHRTGNSFAALKGRRVAMRRDRCPEVFLSARTLVAIVKFWFSVPIPE